MAREGSTTLPRRQDTKGKNAGFSIPPLSFPANDTHDDHAPVDQRTQTRLTSQYSTSPGINCTRLATCSSSRL